METKHHPTGLEGTPLGDAIAARETMTPEQEKTTENPNDEAMRMARLAAMEEDREERTEEVEKIARRK